MELAPGIHVFDDVFLDSASYIKSIEEQNINWQNAEVLVDPDKGVSGKNIKARDTDTIRLSSDVTGILEDFAKAFEDNISPKIDEYKDMYYATTTKKESPQLLRYGVGQQFHNHIDDHPSIGTRRVSLSYYINDDYEGGEIEFPRFNLKIKPKAKQLVVFPSNFIYNHQVHPVISGTRYVVVQWIA
jgi:predicted 2-oxoglutarate/Fe(II)-dependent dioxygenase YbiX